jgi:hypothetical protein
VNGRAGACKPNEQEQSASDGKALAAFGATPRQNESSCASGHARAKSVGALAMQITGLIGALHAESRRKFCAKTSTWWAETKGGKGTQQGMGCQAHNASMGKRFLWPEAVDNPLRMGIDSPLFLA